MEGSQTVEDICEYQRIRRQQLRVFLNRRVLIRLHYGIILPDRWLSKYRLRCADGGVSENIMQREAQDLQFQTERGSLSISPVRACHVLLTIAVPIHIINSRAQLSRDEQKTTIQIDTG